MKMIKRTGTAILIIITFLCMTCQPSEPQGEIEPYMTVHRSIPTNVPVKVELWQPQNKEDKQLEYTDTEIALLERMTMSEASIETYDCKVATCVTTIKRSKLYGKTIEEVIYEPYQYSLADNGKPTEEVSKAVKDAIETEGDYPDTMIYFRANYFHSFGVPYAVYGNHYFSLSE